jgi:hypothetical protein
MYIQHTSTGSSKNLKPNTDAEVDENEKSKDSERVAKDDEGKGEDDLTEENKTHDVARVLDGSLVDNTDSTAEVMVRPLHTCEQSNRLNVVCTQTTDLRLSLRQHLQHHQTYALTHR